MSEIKYERIHVEPDIHSTQTENDSSKETNIEILHRPKITYGVMQAVSVTLGLIAFYFVLSIGLTFYQRWFLEEFHFPLFVVLCHLMLKLFMSAIIRLLYRLITGKSRINIDWKTSIKKISPTGLASGIDIGFSNWGLALVTISLYTMTKSTSVIFILFFATLLGLEKRSWSMGMIVVMISSGLLMFTYKSTQFNALGFLFVLFASLTSGIRWSFAQLIMQKSKLGLHNPVDMVYHMQPWMVVAILPFTLGFEGHSLYSGLKAFPDIPTEDIVNIWAKITIGAVIAFTMELSEFLVLSYTSSLTLSIAGIFKEIFLLVLAVVINNDQLSLINILGLIMCLGGICSHVIHKYSTMIGGNKIEDISSYDKSINDRQHQVQLDYLSNQNIPLLDSDSDTDDLQNTNANSSEVIFDVLKRRDARR